MKSCISPFSSLNKGYIFFFLSINPFFTSIAWSHIFLMYILLLTFFPKTWTYLWNLEGTNLLVSFSNFSASLSSQISHCFTTLFISTIFPLFNLLLLLSFFLYFFTSCFFPFSSFSSSSLCFYHPDFPCFIQPLLFSTLLRTLCYFYFSYLPIDL